MNVYKDKTDTRMSSCETEQKQDRLIAYIDNRATVSVSLEELRINT